MASLMVFVREAMAEIEARAACAARETVEVLREDSAQGTTEYAILVGVLVVARVLI